MMDEVIRSLVVVLAIASSFAYCQELPVNYAELVVGDGAGMCPATHESLIKSIKQDICSLINNSVLPAFFGYGACG